MSRRRSSPAARRSPRRGYQRAGVWEAIQGAEHRARQRASGNQRSGHTRRRRCIKAAIAETSEEEYLLNWVERAWRTLIGLLLIVPSAISTCALFTISSSEQLARENNFWLEIAQTRPFLFFSVGAFLAGGWFFSKVGEKYFLYLYVLGHELTHAFFILLCGGRISGFKVGLDGGYVMTDKTNILIALSPYFVPFWSVVVLALTSIVDLFWNIPHLDEALYWMIGSTWCFHLLWTLWMIPRDQPDLKENGTFFSLVLIYMANVLLLAGLLCLAPEGLNFTDYGYHWANLFMDLMEFGRMLVRSF